MINWWWSLVEQSWQHLRQSRCHGKLFLSVEFETVSQESAIHFEDIQIYLKHSVDVGQIKRSLCAKKTAQSIRTPNCDRQSNKKSTRKMQ